MGPTQKTLWGEGMLLTPHHFQQWDRYYDSLLRQRMRTLRALDWGLRDLGIDLEAVEGGKFALQRCSGVMPDGFFFDAPGRDPLPATRDFRELFGPQQAHCGVYVGVPTLRGAGLACPLDGENGQVLTPYLRGTLEVADETRQGSEQDIATAVTNLRVLFEGEPLDEYMAIKVADIVKTPTGGYMLSESFVPTCQYISVSPYLTQCLVRIIRILSQKSEEMVAKLSKTGGMAEAAAFWLLHTVNSHIPLLQHFNKQEKVHPELLFLDLVHLGAQLCTFAGGQHPRDLPLYDHSDLSGTFVALDKKMRMLLNLVIPTKCVPIPLERSGEALFFGNIVDDELFMEADFFIAVGADVEKDKLIKEIPAHAKISSRDGVQQLLMSAVSGLRLNHKQVPPDEIAVAPNREYFHLEKHGPHWEAITSSHTIAIHIPPEYPKLQVELMAVRGKGVTRDSN